MELYLNEHLDIQLLHETNLQPVHVRITAPQRALPRRGIPDASLKPLVLTRSGEIETLMG